MKRKSESESSTTPSPSGSGKSASASPSPTKKKRKNINREFHEKMSTKSLIKLQIVRRYIEAWVAIICQSGRWEKPVFIDGFAGSGIYSDGNLGSPLVAYKAVAEHQLKSNFKPKAKLQMIFIEKDPNKARKLEIDLDNMRDDFIKRNICLKHVTYEVRCASFAEEMEKLLITIPVSSPILAFVDPFGFSGHIVPMTLMKRIIQRARYAPVEIIANIMDGEVLRFIKDKDKAECMQKFFGVGPKQWTTEILPQIKKYTKSQTKAKLELLMNLYYTNLIAGLRRKMYKLQFGMRCSGNNRQVYSLLYVTRSLKPGIKSMKYSMWKDSQKNEDFFEFSEFHEDKNTPLFNTLKPEDRTEFFANKIETLLENEFRGKGCPSGKQFENYIMEHTIYQFNVKPQLRKKFEIKNYILISNPKFEKIIFQIPQQAQLGTNN